MEFDISSIPAGAIIQSAQMRIVRSWSASYNTIGVHRVLSAWNEATVTYAGFVDPGAWEGMPFTTFMAGGSGPSYVDVTALTQAWVSGAAANEGVALTEAPVNRHYFFSCEHSNPAKRPMLEVTYNPYTGPLP